MAIFGCADGWVHAVRLSDGALVWKFFAAPADVKTVALNQVESLWPVHGSVLILDGVAYCSAGRSTWLDGGIWLWGLDPATGKILHKTHYASTHPDYQKLTEVDETTRQAELSRTDQNMTDYKTSGHSDLSDAFSMEGGTIRDVLVSDGRNVFLHTAQFDAKLSGRRRRRDTSSRPRACSTTRRTTARTSSSGRAISATCPSPTRGSSTAAARGGRSPWPPRPA